MDEPIPIDQEKQAADKNSAKPQPLTAQAVAQPLNTQKVKLDFSGFKH